MALQVLSHEAQYYRQKIGQTTTLSIGVASASTQLQPGRYRLIASSSCYLRQGGSSVTATSSDMPLNNDSEFIITVDGQRHSNGTDSWNDANDGSDTYIAVIRQAANGTLYITKLSDLQAT